MFELGKDLLYRIEVWAVGWKIEDHSASIFDGSLDAGNFVTAEIVQNNKIAGLQRWREKLLCPSSKAVAIDGTIEDAGCLDPVVSQCRDESRRLPMPVWCHAIDPLSFRASTIARRHVGRRPSLVDKNQLLRSQFGLLSTPFGARSGNILSRLFSCTRGLFFRVRSIL